MLMKAHVARPMVVAAAVALGAALAATVLGGW